MLEFVKRIFRNHWGKMLGFFVFILGAVALVTFLTPRVYTSEAKIFVRLGRENATLDSPTTLGQGPVVAIPTSREWEMGSILEMIRSKVLLEEVVARLGPEAILNKGPIRTPLATPAPVPPAMSREPAFVSAVRTLNANLTIEHVKKSTVLSIVYEGGSSELAQAVVSTLVELATRQYIVLHRSPGTSHFLTEQADRLRSKLVEEEDRLRQLKTETGLFVPENQRQAAVARVDRLRDEILQTRSALAGAEAEVAQVKERAVSLPKTEETARISGGPNTGLDAMRGQLYTLRLREQELLARHSPGHPEVQAIRQQVEKAREQLGREEQVLTQDQVTTGPSKLYSESRSALLQKEPALVALKARVQALEAQYDQETQALEKLIENEVRLARQQREVDLLTASYRKYAENAEQTQIDQALEAEKITNLSLAQPASYDPDPIRPRMSFNLAVGFCLALLGSAALGWLLEMNRPSEPTPEPSSPEPEVS